MSQCRLCGGEGVLLGLLGRWTWFRCRRCGNTFHAEEEA